MGKKKKNEKKGNGKNKALIVKHNDKKSKKGNKKTNSEITTQLLSLNDDSTDSKLIDLSVSSSIPIGESKKNSRGFGDEAEDEGVHVLKNISMKIKKKAFIAVVGEVGSGKSSLLSAILADMRLPTEKQYQNHGIAFPFVRIDGRISYVSQKSWIQNMTVKNNILFGSEYDEEKFNEIVKLCCLQPDFAVWSKGADTMIGEKGVNCSGGQKARISLARALYSDADIIMLDDILSAVDAHVGGAIFDRSLKGKNYLY